MGHINHRQLRRLYEAACRDRKPWLFESELRVALEKRELDVYDFRLSKLFEEFVPDGRELLEYYNPRNRGGYQIFEATADVVSSSMFSNITGQIVYNAMLRGYQGEDFVFTRMVQNVPTSFNGERIPGITALGDAAQEVKEGGSYPLVGVGEDWIDTPQTKKFGLIVPVTKEAIFFDRTNMIVDQARKVGEALGWRKEKRIIDAFIDENDTSYRYKWKNTVYATYQATSPWINVKTSNGLLDYTKIDAAEQIANNIVDPHTGEPISIMLKHLVVTKQNEMAARRIINGTEIDYAVPGYATSANPSITRGPNPMAGKYEVVTSKLLAGRMATDTDWYLANIPEVVKYMENWPLAATQAPVNSDMEFERDIVLRFKGSERGTPAVVEPRASIKSSA